jgi:multidrug efflux pump subunit AcrA (membrane-fusion protein)
MRNGMKNGIKNEMNSEMNHETSNEMSHEIKNEMSYEISNETKNEMTHEISNKTKNEMSYEINNETKNEMTHEISNKTKNGTSNGMRNYLEKYTHMKNQRLKYDFLPALQELIERPAHIGGGIIIFAVFSLILSAVLWAAFMEIDAVISVSGAAEPAGELLVVQAQTGGVVERIQASPGDLVQEGDPLLTLRQEVAQIDTEEVRYKIDLLTAQKGVYEELYGGKAPEDVDLITYGAFLWEANRILMEQEVYNNNVGVLETQAKDALSPEEAALQIENYKLNRRLEIAERISACIAGIREGYVTLEKAEINREAGTVRAAATGYITEMAVNTMGQVVTPSQVIAHIVPEDAPLLLRCYAANKDISRLRVGQSVQIKWNTYPYSRYGAAGGNISYISPAAAYSEQMGYVYMIQVTFDHTAHTGQEKKFLPGMSAVADIRTEQRTVLEYFLDPIREGLDSSLREP